MKIFSLVAVSAAISSYAAPAQAQEEMWGGLVVFADGGPISIERSNEPYGSDRQSADGSFVGGGLQYNWQTGVAVLGFEFSGHAIDAQARALLNSCSGSSCDPAFTIHRTVSGEWDASAIAHVGFAVGNHGEFHPYLFGGYKALGYAETWEDVYPTEPSWNYKETKRSVATGEVFGAGIDWSPVDGYVIGLRYEKMEKLPFTEYSSGYSEVVGGETKTIRLGFIY